MRLIVAVAGLSLLSFSAQAAQPYYSWTEGNWSVGSGPGQCVAVSRPVAEFAMAPFVALSFIQKIGSEPRMRVHFWPGAFANDEVVSLRFSFGTGHQELDFVAGGTAIRDDTVELERPFPHREIVTFADADTLLVKADDAGRQVGFNVSTLDHVSFHLGGCSMRLATD